MKIAAPSLSICIAILLASSSLAQEVLPTSANLPMAATDEQAEIEKTVRIAEKLGAKASTPAQLVQLTRGLNEAAASEVFLQVGRSFLQQGHVDVAADTLLTLMKQYPNQRAAAEAGLLLVQLYSSSEMAHAKRDTRDAASDLRLPPGWQRENAHRGGIDNGQHTRQPAQALLAYSTHLARGLLEQSPKLAESPEFAFQCAVLARRGGRPTEVKSWLAIARHQQQSLEWRERALAELWLQDRSHSEPSLPVTLCRRAAQPPHLDGLLNDLCWQSAEAYSESEPGTEINFTYDEQHLYLSGRYDKCKSCDYSSDDRPRTYDANLAGHDRVELLLDADRDYVSYFRLAIDHRGWTNDAAWLDRSWNPRWYVAAKQDDASWTFEAAIAWSELVSEPPRRGDAWAVASRHRTPSEASAPAAEFQILLFD